MRFILDLDDTLAQTTRDMRGDESLLPNLTLAPGAKEFIAAHGKESVLLSSAQDFEYQRKKIVHLRLDSSFEKIILVIDDKKAALAKIIKETGKNPSELTMIGDRIDRDIAPANALGLITVRMALPEGRYSSIEPQSERERPTYTARDFFELMSLPLFA